MCRKGERPVFKMLPFEEREPDYQYRNLISHVWRHGEEVETQQGVNARTIIGAILRYRFSNGFPLGTERNLAPTLKDKPTIWQQAISEILAFVNGAMTLEELESFGCYWWADFVTEKKCAKRGLLTGDLGPGSYGGAFAHFPTKDGGEMNQWKVVLDQAKNHPILRTLMVSGWVPNYIPRGEGYDQKVVVAPCHGVAVHLRILNGKLHMTMFQRSADLVLGVPSNIAQYSALALAIGQVLGIEVHELVHEISDAHIYVDHGKAVEEMIGREPRSFPTMTINPKVKDLFAFRRGDFVLSDYYPHPGIKGLKASV